MDENIPELTDEEIAKLPFGTKYKQYGVSYQTFHPTPVGAVLPQSYSAQPQSAGAPSSTPSFMDNFSHDWAAAQDNYGKALQVGMSSKDADQLYLKPVQDKWEIASRNNGAILRNPDLFNQFNSEFNTGIDTAQRNYAHGGSAEDSIRPLTEKWSAAPSLPPTKPLPTADAKLLSNLPQQVINEVKQTIPVPQANKGTDAAPIWKPYGVKMTAKDAKGLRDDTLSNLHSGMDLTSATRKAITDRFGDSPSLEPNIVTNKPAIPAVKHKFWFDEAAQPAELSTNYFKIKPGQLNGNESGDGVVDAPVDKGSRKVNQKYVLPNGKIGQWNGKGWQLVKE